MHWRCACINRNWLCNEVFVWNFCVSDVFWKRCINLYDCRVSAVVWNNTHTGQPASFTALTEFLRENIRLWLVAHPKIPSLPGIPTWVLFILYRLFITQITVSTCNIHGNRWKFIYNRYKVLFSVICNLAYCVYIFLSQIQGQIKKKD